MRDTNERRALLKDCMNKLQEMAEFYIPASPNWTLLKVAHNHVMTVHHLEAETNFNEDSLCVANHENIEGEK